MLSFVPVAAVLAAVAAAQSYTPVTVSVDLQSPKQTVDERFLSLCFDASVIDQADPFGFFASRRVRNMVAALAPAYFRFSGTAIDSVEWNENGASCVANGNPHCLNSTHITELLNLTSSAGVDLVMGLNGRLGKNATAPDAAWNSTNAAAFLAWLAATVQASGGTLQPPAAFELGNEPDLWHYFFGVPVNGSALVPDLAAVRRLVAGAFPAQPVRTFGPDSCNCYHGDTLLRDYAAALASSPAGPGHALTFHFYNGGSPVMPLDMVSVERADTLLGAIAAATQDVAVLNGSLPLAIGETGECVQGGCMVAPPGHGGFSEEFADAFLLVDKLGVSAAMNVSTLFREKIFGGNDGIINPLSLPAGSFWLLLAHKQLVGTAVLDVANSTAPGRTLRAYSHCAKAAGAQATLAPRLAPAYPPGAVVLLLVNLDNVTGVELSMVDSGAGGAPVQLTPRDEYVFTGQLPPPLPNDTSCFFGPQSHKLPYLPAAVCLNGQLLYLADGPDGLNSSVPALVPATVTGAGQPLRLDPLSVAFVVLPDAQAPACT